MCGIYQKLPPLLLLPSVAWHLRGAGGWQGQDQKSEMSSPKGLLLSTFLLSGFLHAATQELQPTMGPPHPAALVLPAHVYPASVCGHPQPLLFHFWLTQKTIKRKSEATEVRKAQRARPATTSPGLCQGRDVPSANSQSCWAPGKLARWQRWGLVTSGPRGRKLERKLVTKRVVYIKGVDSSE